MSHDVVWINTTRWARHISSIPVKPRSLDLNEWVFEFQSASPLPIVDLSVTPLLLLAGDVINQRFFNVMRKHYAKLIVFFRIGAVFMAAAHVAKAEVGRVCAIVTCALGFGSLVASTLMMSSELFRLAWSTHEVVSTSMMNTVNWIILASLYRGIRSASCLRNNSVAHDDRLCHVVFLRVIDVPSSHYMTIKVNNIEVDTVDVFVNVSSTLCILVGCIVYRRRRVFEDASLKLITCALLRSRLMLVPASRTSSSTKSFYTRHRRETALATQGRAASVSTKQGRRQSKLARAVRAAYRLKAPAISFSARSKLLAAALDQRRPHHQQLRIVPQAFQNIDCRNTLVPRLTPTKDLLRWQKRALSGVGFIGTSLTVASFMLLDERGIVSRPVLIALQASALVTSSIYLAVSVACFEKQSIRSLVHRFDLLFSAAQFVSASLLYCAMLRWDTSCLLVLTSVLWFVWILHVDALTPRLRRHLGFKKRHAGWALVTLSICMLRVTASLVFDEANGYHDSILARIPVGSGAVVQFRTKSAFLNRMFPLSVWTLRMLWELMMRHEEELVFIRGTVEYFCPLEMLSVFHSSHVHPDDDAIGPSQGRASVLDMRIRSTS